jgi:hypothetical protein
MRNTILALITVGSLTFAAPAFAGLCTDNPCLNSSPIQGAVDNRHHTDRFIGRCTDRPIKCHPGTLGMLGVTTAAIVTTGN